MSLLLAHTGPRPRLAVLGLDGLPLDLALFLCRTAPDRFPNLGRLCRDAGTVEAELPELSPVNWTSFFTAAGPEEHGVFGFARMDPATYRCVPTAFDHVACPTIFQHLGERGLVSRVVNLPNTYPAAPLRGMLVAGFVAPDLDQAVYPPVLAPKLAEAGYLLEADTSRGSRDPAYLLDQLRKTLDSRLAAMRLLWDDLGWDLFVQVFTETDRLFHFLFDAVADPGHRLHAPCLDFLGHWDEALGQFLARYDALPAPKRLLVMADHGFTELRTEVCVNAWLGQQGLLVVDKSPDDEWDAGCIGAESRAFGLDPGRIYFHTPAFARGKVGESALPALRETVRNGLLDLTFHGEHVMEEVIDGDTLYPGCVHPLRPDLVCVPKPGFDLKAKFDRTEIFGGFGRTGTHTRFGAIFADSHGAKPRRMRDIGLEILNHFDATQGP